MYWQKGIPITSGNIKNIFYYLSIKLYDLSISCEKERNANFKKGQMIRLYISVMQVVSPT